MTLIKVSQGINEFQQDVLFKLQHSGIKTISWDTCTYKVRDRKGKESRVKKSVLIVCELNPEIVDILFSLCLFYRIQFS